MNRSNVEQFVIPAKITPRMIRVVLADDHALIRIGLRNILHKTPDIQVVGEASNGLQALALVGELQPDVLLLDMEMPGLKGIEVAKKLHEEGSTTPILALSAHEDKHFILGMLENGASGYLTKEEAPDVVVKAIRGVVNGERGWVSKRIAIQIALWLQNEAPGQLLLGTRSKEMIRLFASGKSMNEVSRELDIPVQELEMEFNHLMAEIHTTLSKVYPGDPS
jgi:DNA-binding NarL/FixJ family response regulator